MTNASILKVASGAFSALVAAAVFFIAAPSARANVLVYEGFHPTDYGITTTDGTKSANNGNTTGNYTTNVVTGGWYAMGGSQITVYGADFGLALPAEMTAAGFAAQGGSIGLNPDNVGDNAQHRAMSHNLTASTLKVSSGTLYFRMLLSLDSNAAKKLAAGASLAQKNGGYFGFGFGKSPDGNDYYAPTHLQSAISFVIWKNSSNQYVLSFVHTTASGSTFTSYPIVTDITLGTTYLCYAEVKVGAGTAGKEILRAGAMAADAYTVNTPWAELANGSDSVEVELITDSSYPTCMAVAGPYGSKDGSTKGYFRADEIVVGTEIEDILLVSTTKPKLSDGSLSLSGGTYTASAALAQSAADVTYTLSDGDAATTETPVALGGGSFAADSTATGTFAAPTDNTTYEVVLKAENAGGETAELSLGTIYGGTLALTKVSDGNELGCVPATLTVSRENPDPLPLVVNYSFTPGTAVAGVNYVDDAGSVTIPSNATSATITVTPIVDAATATDTSLTVFIAAGNYDAPSGVAVTIANFTTPVGYNYWIGGSATDGKYLASTAANWTQGHAPTAAENIVFNGDFSTADCEWDSAASATVASWTQTADYTGTVQIDTTYDSTFPALNITGNVEILGGKWTHRINEAADGQKYHLKAIVGGDFTLASNCTITAEKKGYWAQKYPAGSTYSAHAASGDGFANIYGNVYRPADLGAGSAGAGSASDNKSGGGAVWLEVGGAATLNGTINVRGRQFDGSNTACGSVYVKAKSCSGSGSILANFSAGSYYNANRGAGGRVAIELTEATTLAFPTANVKINGINAGSSGGGGGTFYVKTADPAKPYGTLYLDDQRGKSYGARWHNPQAITAIPAGETWTFDAIVIRNYGMLAVPAGTTLNLPNGPMSVSATSSRQGGIRYDGGTINWGSAPYEFASNWIFQANAPYTFDGDVVVHDGGTLGCLQFRGNRDLTDFTKCDITVNGNLTVEPGGSISAYAAGPDMDINGDTVSFHGGQSAGASGNKAYDSIFSPRLPGYGTASGDQATSAPGGGLLLLNVSGAFVNNGSVGATGGAASNAGASGGSISITAGTLSGSGAFRANSASGSSGSGGGGRIAVRLTNGDFAAGFETNFYALGATVLKNNANTDKSSSAGTVYLQGVSDGEKGGTIYVRNDKNALNVNTYTPIPAGITKGGVAPDAVADFKKASLVVGDCARVKLFDTLKMASLEMATGTVLDLNGKTNTVKCAKLGGTKLSPGTYAAGDDAVAGFVTDSGEGGKLVVTGGGFTLIVR